MSTANYLSKHIKRWLSDTNRPKAKIVEDVVNLIYLTEQFVFLPTTKVLRGPNISDRVSYLARVAIVT